MQGDGQVPGGPPGPGNPFGNPFGHPFEEEQDPLDDPLSPFNKSPLGPISNPLTGGVDPLDTRLTRDIQYPLIGPEMSSDEMLDQFERGIENTPPIQPGPDGIDRMLDELEGTIENTPPIRPGPDALRRKLGHLEEAIENLPPEGGHIEPEIDTPQQNSVASGKGTDDMPPTLKTRSGPGVPINRRIVQVAESAVAVVKTSTALRRHKVVSSIVPSRMIMCQRIFVRTRIANTTMKIGNKRGTIAHVPMMMKKICNQGYKENK